MEQKITKKRKGEIRREFLKLKLNSGKSKQDTTNITAGDKLRS